MNAVITGATRGIGKAIALKLASQGYNLALCARNRDELFSSIASLNHTYPNLQIIGLPVDCSDAEQVRHFAGFVQEHFSVTDVLINNAGIFRPSSILDEKNDLLQDQIGINLFAPYYLSKIFGIEMRERQSGHIVNICSIASVKPVIQAGSYSVTKAALLALTRVLREELMPYQVKVTAILPGSTLTSSWSGTEDSRRFVAAEDIASAVLNCLQMSFGCNVDELIIRPVKGEV